MSINHTRTENYVGNGERRNADDETHITVEKLSNMKGSHIIHSNVWSIRNKFHQVAHTFNFKHIDVITLSETYLTDQDLDDEFLMEGYNLIRRDRMIGVGTDTHKTKGGGVCTYIREGLPFTELTHLNQSNVHIEMQCVSIRPKKRKQLLLLNCYRPPAGLKTKFIETLSKTLENFENTECDIVVLGDMNINVLVKNDVHVTNLIDTLFELGLRQQITDPTRYSVNPTCLDLVFTNSNNMQNSGVISTGLSDHETVYVTWKSDANHSRKVHFEGRNYRYYDKERFQIILTNKDWTSFYDHTDPDMLWGIMNGHLQVSLDELCPYKKFNVRERKEPWITPDILERIKTKDEICKMAKKSGKPDDLKLARLIRNSTTKFIRKARENFIHDLVESNTNDPKQFWKKVGKILPGKIKTHKQVVLLDDDSNPIDDSNTPDVMNRYFTEIGPKLASSMNVEWSFYGSGADQTIPELMIDITTVQELIKQINTNKSSALDGISATALKDALQSIPEQLTYLFNKSLASKTVPLAWKSGLVIPIPKGGDQSKCNNYRPITLLPVPGKLLEKAVCNHLNYYLETNNILSTNQGGFRTGFSTIQSVSDFTDDILRERNVGNKTAAIFADMSKAFDTVNHSILVNKLENYGVKGQILEWIKNYLNSRKQCTMVNGTRSTLRNIECGVPQGSILGPVLFLIYINDLEHCCTNVHMRFYADDTVLYVSGNDLDVLQPTMQASLDKIVYWCAQNKLSLNINKTKYMIFTSKKNFNIKMDLKIDSVPLVHVHTYKYLGITLDPTLCYEPYMKNIIKNASFRIYQLMRLKNCLPRRALIRIFKSYVVPIFDYGDILYTNCSKQLLNKMQRVQNRGLKVCLKVPFRTATNYIHSLAHVAYLSDRRDLHLKTFGFYRAHIDMYLDKGRMNSRRFAGPILKYMMSNTAGYSRSIEFAVANSWNSLPVNIRVIPSADSFKSLCKSKLHDMIFSYMNDED